MMLGAHHRPLDPVDRALARLLKPGSGAVTGPRPDLAPAGDGALGEPVRFGGPARGPAAGEDGALSTDDGFERRRSGLDAFERPRRRVRLEGGRPPPGRPDEEGRRARREAGANGAAAPSPHAPAREALADARRDPSAEVAPVRPASASPTTRGRAARRRVAEAALAMTREDAGSWGLAGTPTSQHPELTGNRHPGRSRLRWLRGEYKCNHFAGEALHRGGFEAPTWRMKDGSVHYRQAEAWPRATRHFDTLSGPEALGPGDVVILDNPKASGARGAHALIVLPGGRVAAAGRQDARVARLEARGLSRGPDGVWRTPTGDVAHFLRPKRRRS